MGSIHQRQKNEQGKWRYQRINTGRGRRPANLTGPFFLRTKGQWVPVGETLEEARREADEIQDTLVVSGQPATANLHTTNLHAKIETFNAETKANKSHRTWTAYNNSLRYFQECCRKHNVEDVTREDLPAFKTYLREEKLSERSVYNAFHTL